MKFIAEINIMPHKALLDPQGKAVSNSMKSIGLGEIENVRVGKRITLEIAAGSPADAAEKAETACKKLLANQVMEYYEINISEQ